MSSPETLMYLIEEAIAAGNIPLIIAPVLLIVVIRIADLLSGSSKTDTLLEDKAVEEEDLYDEESYDEESTDEDDADIKEDVRRMKYEASLMEHNIKGAKEYRQSYTRVEEDEDDPDDKNLPADTQKTIRDILSYKTRFNELNWRIKNLEVSEELDEIDYMLTRIVERTRDNPSSAFRLHRLIEYYFPTIEKLLGTYNNLEEQLLNGESINSAKREIKESLKDFNRALKNIFNDMFQDEAMDISTDASVMRTMLKQDGFLEGDIFSASTNPEAADKSDKEDVQILKEDMSLKEIIGKEADDSSMFCDDIFDD